MPILNNGHYEIMDEFYDRGQTDRAKRIIAGTTGWKPGPDTDATRYSSYVAAVRDWSGGKDIGGEVATIIVERGKGWRWFHRPDNDESRRDPLAGAIEKNNSTQSLFWKSFANSNSRCVISAV